MTLTEQLATESLPEYTEFYVRKKDGSTGTQTWLNRRHSSAVEWWNTFNITEVLAPVPSYEEWQELIGRKNWCNARAKNLLEKNQQLKELLKECRERLGDYAEFCIKGGYLNAEDEAVKMITKIDNAIGEKK